MSGILGTIRGGQLQDASSTEQACRRLEHELERRGVIRYRNGVMRRRGRYYVDPTGELLLPIPDAALHGEPHLPDGADRAFGYLLEDDGQPVLLERPRRRPFTLEQLEAAEQAAEHDADRRAEAEAEAHCAFLAEQPRRPLTLADLKPNRPTPTLRDAADTLADVGATLEPTEHGFRILVPERFAEADGPDLDARRRVREAAAALHEARELVHQRLLDGRPLPDLAPPIGGGGAVVS